VKPYISKMDKIPNYDGYLELVDDSQAPIGKVEVQVKKLSDRFVEDPRCQCDIGFIRYCEMSVTPVLLILVDTVNKIGYWALPNKEMTDRANIKENAKTIVIRTPRQNSITKEDTRYIDEWRKIIEDSQRRIHSFPQIQQDLERATQRIGELSSMNDYSAGEVNSEFITVHRYLDELNSQLDDNFSQIKRILYPSCWKIGLAYNEYSNTRITYILHSIPTDRNDVQIKKITAKNEAVLRDEGISFVGHYRENPIQDRPEVYARERILRDLKAVFKKRLLPIRCRTLANEMIIAFIERFEECLGLGHLDEYSLSDVRVAMRSLLPMWIDEALRTYGKDDDSRPVIKLDNMLSWIPSSKANSIREKALARMKSGEPPSRSFFIVSDRFPMQVIFDSVDWLISQGMKTVPRVYEHHEVGEISADSHIITPEFIVGQSMRNAEILFSALPVSCDAIIAHSFPNLRERVSFYQGFDCLVAILNSPSTGSSEPITVEMYELRSKNSRQNKTSVYLRGRDNVPIEKIVSPGEDIAIDGEVFTVVSYSRSQLRVDFGDCPLIDEVYKVLEERLQEYLNLPFHKGSR